MVRQSGGGHPLLLHPGRRAAPKQEQKQSKKEGPLFSKIGLWHCIHQCRNFTVSFGLGGFCTHGENKDSTGTHPVVFGECGTVLALREWFPFQLFLSLPLSFTCRQRKKEPSRAKKKKRVELRRFLGFWPYSRVSSAASFLQCNKHATGDERKAEKTVTALYLCQSTQAKMCSFYFIMCFLSQEQEREAKNNPFQTVKQTLDCLRPHTLASSCFSEIPLILLGEKNSAAAKEESCN